MEKLNELVELAKKATPGGWATDSRNAVVAVDDQANSGFVICAASGCDKSGNAAFIAAASPENIRAIAGAFRALEKQRDALAAENAALKDSVALLLEDARRVMQVEPNAGTESRINTALSLLIRASNAGKDGVEKTITALHVERDEHGYWSHPDYLAFCGGREFIPAAEFDQWMSERGLQWKVEYRDEEEIDPNVDGYDLSTWTPEAPAGDGWFVGSIHDTEDGAVCIWLRAGKGGA